MTGDGHRSRTPADQQPKRAGDVAEATAPRPQTSGLPPGRTLSRRASGPTPYALPSDAGQDIRESEETTAREGRPLRGLLPGLRPERIQRVATFYLGGEMHLATAGPPAPVPRTPTRRAPCDATGGPRHPLGPKMRNRTKWNGVESPPFDSSDLSRLPLNGFTYY